ncbi:MAG: hypothetical protein M3123_07545, partial [Actinomycetota bacterium]|nr:hypothetical protein [Actinomycetota bacterium]
AAPRDGRRRPLLRSVLWLLGAVLVGLVFLLGLALGRVLAEQPDPGESETRVRTLEPATLPPVTRTVTVASTR